VLRLMDARTGSYAEIRPARSGLLRLCAHVPEGAGPSDISGPRVLLAADLLTRIAEVGDLQAITVLASDGWSAEQAKAVAGTADQLGIHPPAALASCRDAPKALGGPIDVHLVSGEASAADRRSGLVVLVGAARMPTAERGQREEAVAGLDHEPLAVRLALLSVPLHQPAEVTEDIFTGARQTLGRWRGLVARWAEEPSKPAPARTTTAVQAAYSDLDTASVLTVLDDLALDAGVPAGAKFEAFLYADRVLGLELARDIGLRAFQSDA
jgi:hypothetical protein